MFNEAFNHGKKFTFDSDNLPDTDLTTFVNENGNKQFTVKAVFINPKSKFGPRPCVVCSTLKIWLPNHFLGDVEAILNNQDMIDAINNGKCGFVPSQYTDKNGVMRNSGKFIDI